MVVLTICVITIIALLYYIFYIKCKKPEQFVDKISRKEIATHNISPIYPIRNVSKYHEKIFSTKNRTKYYLGNLTSKMYIKMYDAMTDKNYIIDSSILDDENVDTSKEPAWKYYMAEIREYYRRFRHQFPAETDPRFIFVPGDVSHTTKDIPFLSKTRPISSTDGKNVILPFNNARHWDPVSHVKENDIPFDKKKNKAIWRGIANGKDKRSAMINMYYKFSDPNVIDIGFTKFLPSYVGNRKQEMIKDTKTMKELLTCKYLISVEGNDVATNLKWVLASNSVCIMPIPRTESWLMEGLLIPWVHYIPINDDFSNLEETIQWGNENPDDVIRIINSANSYMSRFMDSENEINIINQTMKGYNDNVFLL
jgi:hypothetical protein